MFLPLHKHTAEGLWCASICPSWYVCVYVCVYLLHTHTYAQNKHLRILVSVTVDTIFSHTFAHASSLSLHTYRTILLAARGEARSGGLGSNTPYSERISIGFSHYWERKHRRI